MSPAAPRPDRCPTRLLVTIVVALCAFAATLYAPPRASASVAPATDRVAGRSRIGTAIEMSSYQFPDGADEVYLARSDVLADAVAAGSLSAGPVLLVPPCGPLPDAVAEEIARLAPRRVVALGGPNAVCPETLVQASGGRTGLRLAGSSRVTTAIELSRYEFPGRASRVYLARSDVFADAVAAGSLSGGPVLLVPACGPLPAAVSDEIARLDPDSVVALGGTNAVCDDVRSQAAAGRRVQRLAGSSRVTTAVALSEYQFPDGADEVYLARSDVLADAVAAGSLSSGPVLLVPGCGGLPAAVRAEIGRLAPARVVALGGPSAVCTDLLREASGRSRAECSPAPVVDDLGSASTASPVVSSTLMGGRTYVVTRGLEPPVLGVFDHDSRAIVDTVELPAGRGAWASTAAQDGILYVGTYLPASLFRVDTTTMEVTQVATFPRAAYVHGLSTAPDGTIHVGTLPDGAAYAYDPADGSVRDYGAAVPGEYAVRSIASTADTIFAGVGARAHLVAIDRETGERRDLLPPALHDESFVYTLAVSDEWLVAGTEPNGRVAIMRLDDPSEHRVLPDLGERTVDAIAIDGSDVYFTGRTTGAVYHYDIEAQDIRALGVPVAREETRGLFVHGRTLIGTGGTGAVWRHDLDGGGSQVTDLRRAGLPGGAEPVHSLLDVNGTTYVGGHWGMQVHTPDGAVPERVRVPGEPKAMADVGGVLYAALYPSGEIWRYDPRDGRPSRTATIGHEQARPRDMDYDPESGRVLVASQSDYGLLGGALTVLDPASGDVAVHRDLVADQSVRSVVGAGDVVYVGTERRGGGGTTPADDHARLAAWDLGGGRKLWDTAPVEGATAIVDVVTLHGRVYGLTAEGVLFALSPRTRDVLRTTQLGPGRQLVVQNDELYVTTSTGLYRVDPDTFAAGQVVVGPGHVHLAGGSGCGVVVGRSMNLLRVHR